MKEIEVKILEINKDEVIKKLEKLGAEKILEETQKAEIYDYSDKGLTKKGHTLRVRQEGSRTEFTLKKDVSRGFAKVKKEFNVEVNDPKVLGGILKELGLSKIKSYAKQRISYKFGEVRFDLDKVEGIPMYLEIEAPNEILIKKYVKVLGFSEKEAKNWTGEEVFKHYNKKY